MMRGMTILWTVLALCVGVGLFLLKYEVQSLEEKLARLNGEIRHNQESIHILKAEWSYLNDPERLRELNERHLSLKAFRPDQIVSIAELPMATPKPEAPSEPAPTTSEPPARVMVDAPQPAKPVVAPKPPIKTLEAKAPAPAAPPVVKALELPKVSAKPAVVAVAKPAAAPQPTQTLPTLPVNAPVLPVMTQPQPNVLVIKSPALLEAERGRR